MKINELITLLLKAKDAGIESVEYLKDILELLKKPKE